MKRHGYQKIPDNPEHEGEQNGSISSWVWILVGLSLSLIVGTIVVMTYIPCWVEDTVVGYYSALKTPFIRNSNLVQSQRPVISTGSYRVVLVGDSLVNRPFIQHNLGGKIQEYLPEYLLDIKNCGVDGAKIETTRNSSLSNCVLPAEPDAVILFWHSDASDVDEASLPDATVGGLHDAYRENVLSVIETLQAKADFVALSSTGVCGETKAAWGQPNSERFNQKTPILNLYTDMNREIADLTGIPFINVREAFLDAVPWYQLCYRYCVTYDGEHENERGTRIVARLFADALRPWLQRKRPVLSN
jgi:hypothetical protein